MDQWMMATTAQTEQQTGDGLAAGPPVHFQDESYSSYQRAQIIDMNRRFSGWTLAHESRWFPKRNAASATLKTNFSCCLAV